MIVNPESTCITIRALTCLVVQSIGMRDNGAALVLL